MPWKGPTEPGEFPTLGYAVGEHIEATCIVPDGPRMGEPYLLTDEMWLHLLWAYRVRPDAVDDDGSDAFVYGGTQLVRPQKWGKDPFAATRVVAHATGPVVFAGWDATGEPVGMPHPSPWIACAATAEDQTDNTFRPIVTMLRDGPLANTPGLDVGETRVKLPGIGWIEPVTASAKARLGGRFTFVTITESHLLSGTGPTGGLTFARVLKRNVAGMGGMWTEITNAWDPTENSAAQLTHESKAPGVHVDYRPPRRRVSISDEAEVLREIIYLYGDSIRARGGWVSERRILSEILDPATGESEARRFFLNEITAGAREAVDPAVWDSLAVNGETAPDDDGALQPGDQVSLGFDGSRSRACSALVACRLWDGRLFRIGIWDPADYPEGRVPRVDVDTAVQAAFTAYDVGYLYSDPYLWQDYLDVWSALYPKRIVEFPTNVEVRMDKAIERFLTAIRAAELTHDGDELVTRHIKNAALAKGKRKQAREDGDGQAATHYLKIVPKREGLHIDAAVAAVLAYEARGQAIEDGALSVYTEPPATARVEPAAAGAGTIWRPTSRLNI